MVAADDGLLLVPFAEPLSQGQTTLLLQHAHLPIPESDVPAFAADFYPALRRMVRSRSRMGWSCRPSNHRSCG